MTIEFNRADYPSPLQTREDYERARDEFVVPYAKQQAGVIGELSAELNNYISNTPEAEIDEAKVEDIITKMQEAAAFSDPNNDSDVAVFFREVVALEEQFTGKEDTNVATD